MKKILILCTGNSCRSQMADGILKENLPNSFLIKSAGTKARASKQIRYKSNESNKYQYF